VNPGPGLTRPNENQSPTQSEAEGPMSTITTTTFAKAQMSVAGARHRAIYAWCRAGSEFISTTPNTKHQRLREPSQE
jgi:hypothetical protein